MALFVTKDGKRKSTIALTCFFVSLLFIAVFAALYLLLTQPLYQHLSLGNGAANDALHCIIIGALGTAICCSLFLLRDKRIVPYSFAGLLGFMLLCCLLTLHLGAAERSIMLYVIILYALSPVAIGNLVSWSIYLRLKRRRLHNAASI